MQRWDLLWKYCDLLWIGAHLRWTVGELERSTVKTIQKLAPVMVGG